MDASMEMEHASLSGDGTQDEIISIADAVFNHLVLPARLPHREDPQLSSVEQALIDRLIRACNTIGSLPGNSHSSTWGHVHQSLLACQKIHRDGRLDRTELLSHLQGLVPGGALIIHIETQNAGLLIRRGHDPIFKDAVIFEAFEASPKNEEVVATENALQDGDFLMNLATFLEQASLEATKDFGAVAFKAGATVYEYRNTSEPAMISSLLMAILEQNGRRLSPTILRKRVRDDICWDKTSKPWRRLPMWLVLRVGIERYLSLAVSGEQGRVMYKFLIIVLLAQSLDAAPLHGIKLERIALLKAKICRRLVKLDLDRERCQDLAVLDQFSYLFAHLSPKLERSIASCTEQIEAAWRNTKAMLLKHIPALPNKTMPADERLSLEVSCNCLERTFRTWHNRALLTQPRPDGNDSLAQAAKQHLQEIAAQYQALTSKEEIMLAPAKSEESCHTLARWIKEYLALAMPLYVGHAEGSSAMILTVMETWVEIDGRVCEKYPLLLEFHPVFHPHLLDPLLLAEVSDMERLQAVQIYLTRRVRNATEYKENEKIRKTIFDDPSPGCVADRFYLEAEKEGSTRYIDVLEAIESKAAETKAAKKKEWTTKSALFADLTRRVDDTTCTYYVDETYNSVIKGEPRRIHDPNCPRCAAMKRLERMSIQIYEHPLPEDEVAARTVVFELVPPATFAVYRDVTWFILSKVATTFCEQVRSSKPRCFFIEQHSLKSYATATNALTLASITKPFMLTHYSTLTFPVEWEGSRDSVCRPCGLKPAYYDRKSELWPGRGYKTWSFNHHLRLEIPKSSPLAPLFTPKALTLLQGTGPSSHEVIASHTECPPGVNVHEYMAIQTICSGHSRRWLSILAELGSTNLNFSNETSAMLMRHLALQCGPPTKFPSDPDGGDTLRKIHSIFGDKNFTARLIDEMGIRLDSMAGNWREIHLMDTILTILLRTYALTRAAESQESCDRARAMLVKAREICLRWTEMLRTEIYTTVDAQMAARFQQYALWSAILCKRTFSLHLNQDEPLDAVALQTYIECSISVQDNLVSELRTLPNLLRLAVLSEFQLSWRFRNLISGSLIAVPDAFRRAIASVWPEAEGSPRQLTNLSIRNSVWVACSTQRTEHEGAQTVEYNFVEGLLLVARRPLGKLPQNREHSTLLGELFGDQALMTFPSNLRGMDYVLCVKPFGFQVHIGYNGSEIIIRIKRWSNYYQLIPRERFRTNGKWDLPGPLIDRCLHWMSLESGLVNIVESKDAWHIDDRNWLLDWRGRRCSRLRHSESQVYWNLVDTSSHLFAGFSAIFENVELRRHILVYMTSDRSTSNQAPSHARNTQLAKNLCVELPRLQLHFYVNQSGCLQSPQLRCEIDPDQDAGTWYGLKSKLVCRSLYDQTDRSILVPLGKIQIARIGCHAESWIEPNGNYGTFKINKVLGRIDCVAEPLLLYTKALLHGYTSFLRPDPLTGRTGTEEAISFLSSAICQPWTPLSAGPVDKLISLAQLSPKHGYYPEKLRAMKTSFWDDFNGTTTMQHEAFRPLVDRILALSAELAKFAAGGSTIEELLQNDMPVVSDPHLRQRAMVRRHLYERPLDGFDIEINGVDPRYATRDNYQPTNLRHRNVLELAALIKAWPQRIQTTEALAQELSKSNSIGGYVETFDKVSLSDRLKLNIWHEWGALALTCREKANDPWGLTFLLCPVAFDLQANMPLIKTLAAFAIIEELRDLPLPGPVEYKAFMPSQVPQLDILCKLIEPFRVPHPEDDQYLLQNFASNKTMKRLQDARSQHDDHTTADARLLAQHLLQQWPCASPKVTDLTKRLLVDITAAQDALLPEWKRLHDNIQLSNHLDEVQKILTKRVSEEPFDPPTYVASEELLARRLRGGEVPRLRTDLIRRTVEDMTPKALRIMNEAQGSAQLVCKNVNGPVAWPSYGMVIGAYGNRVARRRAFRNTTSTGPMYDKALTVQELLTIISAFSRTKSAVRQRYAQDLHQSLEAFARLRQPNDQFAGLDVHNWKKSNSILINLQGHVNALMDEIRDAFQKPSVAYPAQRTKWLQAGQFWPALTTVTLMQQLSSVAPPSQFGKNVREKIIQLGVSITKLQRELRLRALAHRKDSGRYLDEESNLGHVNWKPSEYPDWLLLELEANVLIRPDQVDVALATISPSSGANSVLQMNMGQGKTSCIIPMASVVLADCKSLARVIIPKALLLQTAQLLQGRLGGLLNRQIRHVPFSRRTPTTEPMIRAYWNLHTTALEAGAVIICQPEHNLSFMLSSRQRLLDNRFDEAKQMIGVHSWMGTKCRDILDESDYTLAVRTQLIYPSGSQVSVDGHPHRWQVVEAMLYLVNQHLDDLRLSHPYSIEIVRRPGGGYPFVYFLRMDVEEELIRRLTADILAGNGGILPMQNLDLPDRIAIKDFIQNDGTGKKLRTNTLDRIHDLCPDKPSVRQTVYLVRGLLVNRILMMTLKKRWNVQYGLHPQRDPIAVPYHAKGVPSLQSEWGHPDVSILFTCLAFYYDGVNLEQLKQSLESVLKSDDPSSEYDKWTQSTYNFPRALLAWNSINVDDDMQLAEIWRAVRYNTVVIDYFLNNFVFPNHAKQFKVKLQSNGWDIPLFNVKHQPKLAGTQASTKRAQALTTGFSGTNDNRTMLPLNIKQEDLPALAHTNAEVLTYLLHPRSRQCIKIEHDGGRATETDLLQFLSRQNIRILIDAGAVILEMSNAVLAMEWLKIDKRAPAALFFDESNKPWIISRSGSQTPLLASPFADDLGQCLIYLDEAHTRGTDLKLPPDACGALTLGLGQTKDHTVQAAMRLRQLGTTQSVRFFIPPEVWQSILDVRNKTSDQQIDSHDVICWLLDNTCDGIEQLQPLYYAQGIDFCRRMDAEVTAPDMLTDKRQRESYVASIKQEEQQSLRQLYEPSTKRKGNGFRLPLSSNPQLSAFVRELATRRKAFQDTGRAVHASALQEVEQEREVAFEVESVRQVKKPLYHAPLSFRAIHPELEAFARTGRFAADSRAFIHAFANMAKSGTGRKFRVSQNVTEPKLFVSLEYERTVKLPTDQSNDNFMRPVQWVLWSEPTQAAIIVIPEEAEVLIPMLRETLAENQTYLLLYSAPITRKMLHFSDMTFHSIPELPKDWKAPAWFRVQLGIFAGRLYFDWEDYGPICQFMGVDESHITPDELDELTDSEHQDEEDAKIAGARAFKEPAEGTLTSKPLTFMQEWLSIRRHGQDFVHTPMGFLTQGKTLREDHAFFRKSQPEVRSTEAKKTVSQVTEVGKEDKIADDMGKLCLGPEPAFDEHSRDFDSGLGGSYDDSGLSSTDTLA